MSKREQADSIIRNHVLYSIGGGLIPIPLIDMAAVTALQMNMLEQLADLYGITMSRSIAKSFITALTGSTVAKLGASLVKAIPVVGSVVGGVAMSATSGASTYAVGQVAIGQFEQARDLKDVDIEDARVSYEEAFEQGKKVVEEMEEEKETRQPETPDEVLDALEKLSVLKDKGVISAKEFEAQKKKLLDRL